jgi:methyl-accepting chemotaxis protein
LRSLDNLKTKTKLLGGFLLLAVIIAVLGVMSWLDISYISQGTDLMYTEVVEPGKDLAEIDAGMEAAAKNVWKYTAVAVGERPATRADMEKELESVRQAVVNYEKVAVSEEEKAEMQKMSRAFSDYEEGCRLFTQQIDEGQADLAMTVTLEKLKTARDTIDGATDFLQEDNNRLGQEVKKNAADTFAGAERSIFIFCILAVLFAIFAAFLLEARIVKPLETTVGQLDEMAQGDFSISLPEAFLQRRDEIGLLASSVEQMSTALSKLVGGIARAAQEIMASSEELSSGAHEVYGHTQEASAAVEEIAAGLEEVSASTEEMTASGEEIQAALEEVNREAGVSTDQAIQIQAKAEQIQQKAQQSSAYANGIYQDIEGRLRKAIDDARVVNEISSLATVIGGIADQTNLLALNAAIEAARAGEQGRGFAVVAEEVRKLAEESSTTVSSIQKMTVQVENAIGNLVKDAGELLKFLEGVIIKELATMNEIGGQYRDDAVFFADLSARVSELTQSVVRSYREVGQAIEATAVTIEQSSAGAQEVARGVEQVSQNMKQINETAAHLAQMADLMQQSTAKFKVREQG